MSPPDAPDLDAIEARANAATPGPWEGARWEDFVGTGVSYSVEFGEQSGDYNSVDTGNDEATAAFIAHARTDVPALVAALRAAETKLAAIQAHFDHVYAEDDEGEYGNIPDIYDPDFYRGLDFGLRPIRAILDIAEGS